MENHQPHCLEPGDGEIRSRISANVETFGAQNQGHRLPEWLAQRAHLSPRRVALIAGAEQWLYRELDARVSRLARKLSALGVVAGDRVAILAHNSAAFVEIVHALMRLGGILVPLNVRLKPAELAWQLDDVGARLLLYDRQSSMVVPEIANGRSWLQTVMIGDQKEPGVRLLNDQPQVDATLRTEIDLNDVSSIIYTSGTTGRPKGAMLTFGNFWWSAAGSVLNLGHHHDDRWLACLPLFHVGGLSILLRSVIYGITAVVHESFDAGAVNRAIDEDGVTILSVVSTMLQRMLDERGSRPYPSSLRCVLIGGGPVPPSLLQAALQLGAPVVQTYGLTETASQTATLAPDDAMRKLGSAGKPLFPVELRIERDGLVVPHDEVGEIVVRGPTVTRGYYNRPDATNDVIRDGWLHTGDLGYLDEDGYLYVADRRDDLIVSGGENVYPAEVEAVLLQHPLIQEAGVVGIPHDVWGQTVVAAIVIPSDAWVSSDDVAAFCRQRLASYKVPRIVRCVPSLPRNAAGKLLRRLLRDAAAGWSA